MNHVNIVFDGPPGPMCGRFVEAEADDGRSINAGEWVERPDGYWALKIPVGNPLLAEALRYYAERRPMNNPKGWVHVERFLRRALNAGAIKATLEQEREVFAVLSALTESEA